MSITKYKYKGIHLDSGKTIRGTMQADNENAVDGKLREMNIELVEVTKVNDSSLLSFIHRKKISNKDKVMIFVYLEQLTKAGVALLDSLKDTAEACDSHFARDVIGDLAERVQGGMILSEAMREHNKVFDDVEISLVAISERTGSLANAFHDIVNNLKWSADLSAKTKKALSYPIFSLVVIIAVISAMMIFVVPKITAFLIDMGNELSGSTKALIATSAFISNNALKIVVVCIGLFIGCKVLIASSHKVALLFDTLKINIPIFGTVFQKIELSRFCRFFAVTFESGMPALECLDIANLIIKNLKIKEVVNEIRQQVSNGASITNAIESTGQFPNLVRTMFKVGENSGNIKDALENINYFYDREINESIDTMVSSIKPVMLFVVGGLLIWVIVSVFGPLYGMIGKLN